MCVCGIHMRFMMKSIILNCIQIMECFTTFMQYYYEPGGQKFRPMLAVQKYVAEVEEKSPLTAVPKERKEQKFDLF